MDKNKVGMFYSNDSKRYRAMVLTKSETEYPDLLWFLDISRLDLIMAIEKCLNHGK